MSYQNLTATQIYTEKVAYTLDDFAKDFRAKVKEDWGEERVDKDNKAKKTLYQGILVLVIFASQHKPLKMVAEVVLGVVNKETLKITKDIIDMYKKEAEILEGLQMKMFLENLKKYRVSDSLNLELLNINFREWFLKALKHKD